MSSTPHPVTSHQDVVWISGTADGDHLRNHRRDDEGLVVSWHEAGTTSRPPRGHKGRPISSNRWSAHGRPPRRSHRPRDRRHRCPGRRRHDDRRSPARWQLVIISTPTARSRWRSGNGTG